MMRSGVVGMVLVGLLGAACTGDPEAEVTPTPAPTETASEPAAPTALTFGAWGSPEELQAFGTVIDAYNAENDDVQVELSTWEDRAAATEAIRAGEVPDVFMAARGHLSTLLAEELNQPVDELLDERDVEFGDGYQRKGFSAFSADTSLQCMPYGNSPMVIYYNTRLVDFERMNERQITSAQPGSRWTFPQFSAAVEFGTKPRRKVRGIHLDPTLQMLAPLITSAGGKLFDDDAEPTSLAFADDGTREALEQILGLLREPQLTPTREQLERHGGLELFKRGRVAMIAGFRDLVPELRQVEDLDFDVMPLPNLDSRATLGDMTGLCLARDTEDVEVAADFLADLVSADSVSTVAEAGHLVPANLEVAESDAFLQPDQAPATASVFNNSVRDIWFEPLRDDWDELATTVAPYLHQLFYDPIIDLGALGEQIDEASQSILAPEPEESETDTPSGTPGPSETPVPEVDEDDGQLAP